MFSAQSGLPPENTVDIAIGNALQPSAQVKDPETLLLPPPDQPNQGPLRVRTFYMKALASYDPFLPFCPTPGRFPHSWQRALPVRHIWPCKPPGWSQPFSDYIWHSKLSYNSSISMLPKLSLIWPCSLLPLPQSWSLLPLCTLHLSHSKSYVTPRCASPSLTARCLHSLPTRPGKPTTLSSPGSCLPFHLDLV